MEFRNARLSYTGSFQVLAVLLMAGWMFACGGSGGSGTPDAGQDSDADQSDGASDGSTGADENGQATFTKPAGFASVTFFVDDTANQTYADADIEWKGSFVYDPATNIITHDASWAGEVGPYPPLFDDGPIADGGHEMPGATAGDHVFSLEVYVLADDTDAVDFQYGVINEFDNWIWEGVNGEFSLPAQSSDRIDAAGYTIHAFGTFDMKVSLDIAELNEGFLPFDPAADRIYLKGSMNSWDKRQLLDNGLKGDLAAGDGIYTYLHSANLGEHDGLVYTGQHVQFVFMINSVEYKRGDALSDGVSALTNCDGIDDWGETPIFMEPESRGKIENTTLSVCEDGGAAVALDSVQPDTGASEGGTDVSLFGSGFVAGAQVFFGGLAATGVTFVDAGQIDCRTPAGEPGSVAVKVINPEGDFSELADGFTYQAGQMPGILFVQPGHGTPAGGTAVTIQGNGFVQGATVAFGGQAATGVVVVSEEIITCTTPAHAAGTVDVSVTNPGDLTTVFPGGFEFVDQQVELPDWGVLQWPPTLELGPGETSDNIYGRVYESGVTEAVGCDAAITAQLGVGPVGSTLPDGAAGWTWSATSCNSGCVNCGNNDEYMGTIAAPLTAGTYHFTFRFSLDGQNWLYVDLDETPGFDNAKTGVLTVSGR